MATAPRGLADLAAAELRALGAHELSERTAGVRFAGELRIGYEACLWSRVASRVLLEVADWRQHGFRRARLVIRQVRVVAIGHHETRIEIGDTTGD